MPRLPIITEDVIIGQSRQQPVYFDLFGTQHRQPLEDLQMRPRDLADEMSSATARTSFTLPLAEARAKAREIINCSSSDGHVAVVENWRQRSDGQIEFSVRSLPASSL